MTIYLNIQCSHSVLINVEINIKFIVINKYYILITVVYSKKIFSLYKYLFEYFLVLKILDFITIFIVNIYMNMYQNIHINIYMNILTTSQGNAPGKKFG